MSVLTTNFDGCPKFQQYWLAHEYRSDILEQSQYVFLFEVDLFARPIGSSDCQQFLYHGIDVNLSHINT